MAVPKRKGSKARTRTKHSHNVRVKVPNISLSQESGEYVLRHRVDMKTGMYRGKRVFELEELN